MSVVDDAFERLYEALGTVAGLRVGRGVGVRLDPPAVSVSPPQLTWDGYGSDPTSASFVVPVVVRQDERALLELMKWWPPVVAALHEVENAVVRRADPGMWPAGSGVELPAYLITVDVGLM